MEKSEGRSADRLLQTPVYHKVSFNDEVGCLSNAPPIVTLTTLGPKISAVMLGRMWRGKGAGDVE